MRNILRPWQRLIKKAGEQQLPLRGLSTQGSTNIIRNVLVIGSGLMGSGIAQVAAQTGHQVFLVDMSDDILKKAQNVIKTNTHRVARKQFADDKKKAEEFVSETLSRIVPNISPERSILNADVVIEAIVENVDIKRKLFESLERAAPKHTIFTSNTSSIRIGDIAKESKRKDRFGGLHFFNPVPIMKLVEVIKLPETTNDTYDKLIAFSHALGKVPVTCKDTHGFIVNHLLLPYVIEAVRMLERNDASIQDIDTAMKLGAGYPMGPLELLDHVGLDLHKYIMDDLARKFPDNPLYTPSPIVEQMVKEGKYGRKSGEGFYKYKK